MALVGAFLLVVVLVIGSGSNTGAAFTRTDDTYVEAMVGAPRYVNPLLAQTDTDVDLTHLVFNGLTRVDEHGNIVPDLASGWQTNADSTVFTFTLRPDLLWQDGKPLTSEDVYFTLNLLHDPQFPGSSSLFTPWQGVQITVPDPALVVFSLPTSNSSFLQYTTLGILPRHLWSDARAADLPASDLNKRPVGSGPWRYVQSAVAGALGVQGTNGDTASTPVALQGPSVAGVLLEPNTNGPHPQSHISRLWFRLYPTFDAAFAALKAGEIHGLGHIPLDRMADVQNVPGIELHQQTLARSAMLLMNVRSPLFDRPETRQAIELAINRKALVEQTLHMQARAADSPILPQSWAYNPQAKHADYSPSDAGQLLDAAGWKLGPDGIRSRKGETMTVVLAANKEIPSNGLVATQLQSQLRAVGIDVKLALVSRDKLLNDRLTPGAFHLVLANWEAQGADPDVYDYWHSPQPGMPTLNFGSWSNPKADAALEAARLSTENGVRAAHYAEFQQAFKEDVPAVVLYDPLYTYATRPPASGVTLPSTDMLSPAARFDIIGDWRLSADKLP